MHHLSGDEHAKLYRRGMLSTQIGVALGLLIAGATALVDAMGTASIVASPSRLLTAAIIGTVLAGCGLWVYRSRWAWVGIALIFFGILIMSAAPRQHKLWLTLLLVAAISGNTFGMIWLAQAKLGRMSRWQ